MTRLTVLLLNLGEREVQGLTNVAAKLRFDVLAKLKDRGGACASLLHGVPPSPLLLTAICFGQQEVTPFFFFHKTRDTSREIRRMIVLMTVTCSESVSTCS